MSERIDPEELYYKLRAQLEEYYISPEADEMLAALAMDIAQGDEEMQA